MTSEHGYFRVGIMVLIFNQEGKVLLGKRKNAFAAGEYGIPSGHMEKGETFTQAAIREILEETGVSVREKELLLFALSNYIIENWGDQYLTFDFAVTVVTSSISNQEQDKCEGWEWHDLKLLPTPMHYPAQRTIDQYAQYLQLRPQERPLIIS
jgi:8-oxo-dGTP diphosphatase